MEVLRTPDHCFEGLAGFDFEPHYAEIPDQDGGTLRVHYLDEGPADGRVVLLLHGEPSWCYLYRHMIPVLDRGRPAGGGARPGRVRPLGQADAPGRVHLRPPRRVDARRSSSTTSELSAVTLVCQDWGGLIGLRLLAEHPDRFARVVAANTFLPTGDGTPSEAFLGWLKFSQEVETFPTGTIVNLGCATELAPEVIAAYDAPFPDQSYAEGARQFPTLVPISSDDPASAANRDGVEGPRDHGHARSSPPSATAIRSPPGLTGSCRPGYPGPRDSPT